MHVQYPHFDWLLLQSHSKEDTNRPNLFGRKGKVAEEFSKIIKTLREAQHRYVSPQNFTMTSGKIISLQETVNKIHTNQFYSWWKIFTKTWIKEVERWLYGGKQWLYSWIKDSETCLTETQQSNESIFTTLFQDQLRSTVQCLMCHHKSQTSETFNNLSLLLTSTDKCRLQDCLEMIFEEKKRT